MPSRRASRGEEKLTFLPSTKMAPEFGWRAPERMLTSVDLPAPLSPTRPTTSPGKMSRSAPRSAWMLPKCLVTARTDTTGAPASPSLDVLTTLSPPTAMFVTCRLGLVKAGRFGRAVPDSGATKLDATKLRPTMTDVAREARVSLKTVSRVVNGEGNVRASTARGVQNAIEKLGYRRNDPARALRQSRPPRLLGLVTKDVSNPFYSAIARGVEEVVRDRGLLVISGSSDEDASRERELLELLCERRVGGLLVVPTGRDHSFLAKEVEVGTPVVFIDRPPVRLRADTILLDNFGGAYRAVAHLLAGGHRRVALVGDLPWVFTASERLRGYRAAFKAAGLPVDARLVRVGCHDSASAEKAARELLALEQPPTAYFAGNNRITFGVLAAFAGLERPPALIGFDDFELATLLSPPVSVVAYDPVELGRRAARLICDRLDGSGGPPRRIVVPTEVVARGSGEVAPGQDAPRPTAPRRGPPPLAGPTGRLPRGADPTSRLPRSAGARHPASAGAWRQADG